VFTRIRARDLLYWADPGQSRANEINRNDGGRGFYFEDPDGHLLEVITRPYGG
jgi:catechol 2,3-dioxygenase-like lactoylglutathione lyase family enzyme